jgi:hypothetical protein
MMNKVNLVKIWRFFSFISLVFFIMYFYNIKNMITTEKPNLYTIVEVTCKSRSGSSVGVFHMGEYYSIEVTNQQCRNYIIGDKISMYYNSKYNYFYLPNTLYLYKRFIYASFLSIILSFLSFKKLKTKIFNFLDN